MAMSVLSTSARKAFMKYVSQSRLKPNKLEAAKELKKMVFFSNIVVAPLLQDIKVTFICAWITECTCSLY